MGKTNEAQLAGPGREARQNNPTDLRCNRSSVGIRRAHSHDEHADNRQEYEDDDAHRVGNDMDEVWSDELSPKRRDDIGEEHYALRDIGTNEVQGCGEENNVEDIVDKACRTVRG